MTRPVANIVSLTLPLPPSVNAAFASSKAGSRFLIKTAAYKFWTQQVRDLHGDGSQLPVLPAGPYGLILTLPEAMRGDIDNRVKLVSDVVRQSKGDTYGLGLVVDDKSMKRLLVDQSPAKDEITVTLVTLPHWRTTIITMLELQGD